MNQHPQAKPVFFVGANGATMTNIVDEMLFVTDMETAFTAAVKCRQEIFAGTPVVASTIVQIHRLA